MMGMWDHPKHVRLLAIGSLAASALMVLVAMLSSEIPIAPIIMVNWVLFFLTGYTSFRAIGSSGGIVDWKKDRRYQLFNLVLVVFSAAGFFAFLSGARIV